MKSTAEIFLPIHTALAKLCSQVTPPAERWCSGCGVKMERSLANQFVCPKCQSVACEVQLTPSLQSLQDRIADWQQRTFATQHLDGKLAHLCREAAELRANPDDLHEWADVLILLLGAAARRGLTVQDLVATAEDKFAIAQKRQWGPADSEGVHHHISNPQQ